MAQAVVPAMQFQVGEGVGRQEERPWHVGVQGDGHQHTETTEVVTRMEQLLNIDTTPFTGKIIAEYICVGGSGIDLRSKSRTISKPVEDPSELPKWNYDGSSTGQALGEDSEVIYIHKLYSRTHSEVATTFRSYKSMSSN